MRRLIRREALAAVLLLAGGGCATILQGSRQRFPVLSSPIGATVATIPATGQYTTPVILSLARNRTYVLSLSHPGYSAASFRVESRISAGFVVADVILTGPVGVVVDALTGAWYHLRPREVEVRLTKVDTVPGPASIAVRVAAIDHGRGLRVTSDGPGVDLKVTNR